MIEKLDEFHFSKQTDAVITRIRKILNRERNSLNTKASSVENKFLALLNYLPLFEIGLTIMEIIQNPEEILFGIIKIGMALGFVILSFLFYRNRENKQ